MIVENTGVGGVEGGEGGCAGGRGGEWGGKAGEGGEGGGDEGDGGAGEGDGGDGGGDGWVCTTNDLVMSVPYGKEKLCPKPGAAHSVRPPPQLQQNPYESVMLRVHVAPSATTSGTLKAYGAPPLSVVPSEQARLQPT